MRINQIGSQTLLRSLQLFVLAPSLSSLRVHFAEIVPQHLCGCLVNRGTKMASREGFEPPTHGVEDRCSIPLNYRESEQ